MQLLLRIIKTGKVIKSRQGNAEETKTNQVDELRIRAGSENQSPVNNPGQGRAGSKGSAEIGSPRSNTEIKHREITLRDDGQGKSRLRNVCVCVCGSGLYACVNEMQVCCAISPR